MTVHDLGEERLKRSPHTAGTGRCLVCEHEFAVVAPLEADPWFECPKCHCHRATWKYPYIVQEGVYHVWTCCCGNELFNILSDGVIFCPNCGHQRLMPNFPDT